MIDTIEKKLMALKQAKPLILNLTNYVTMDFVANSLLNLGAAPIMSVCEEELEELLQISSALYINIGTLDDKFVHLIEKAVFCAQDLQKPIILDPVGAGATKIRTKVAKFISPFANFIRGNSSEIIALVDETMATYGVESAHATNDAKEVAMHLALDCEAIVMVSGPVDFVTNGKKSFEVPFGSELMPLITGMGCSLTAVIAAFQTVVEDPLEASNVAAHYFALCGEVAAQKYQAPGMFKAEFLDQLYKPDFVLMRDLYKRVVI